MDQRWTKDGPKMDQKWTKNGPKMDQKWTKNGQKMDLKGPKNFKKGLQDYKKNPKKDQKGPNKKSSKLISKPFKTFLKIGNVHNSLTSFLISFKKSHSQIFEKNADFSLIFFRSFDSSYWMNVFWCKFWR